MTTIIEILPGDVVALNGTTMDSYKVAHVGPDWLTLSIPDGRESARLPKRNYHLVMHDDGMLA